MQTIKASHALFILFMTCISNYFNCEKRSYIDWRLSLAGGLAGGMSNAIIYPIDTIKTMMQSDSRIKTTGDILRKLRSNGNIRRQMYSGFIPAVIGAIPSSAIYFGSYETIKKYLSIQFQDRLSRQSIHMLSASCGNLFSSIIFVPKEAIKQNIQAVRTGVSLNGNKAKLVSSIDIMRSIVRKKGIAGLYPSYKATLMRNVPSAVIRFTLYEELRRLIKEKVPEEFSAPGYLIAGAFSSAVSSAATTPFDVVKTRIATGLIPSGSSVLGSIASIARKEGIAGLYAGVQPRILWSALFGGIGFSCLEQSKRLLKID